MKLTPDERRMFDAFRRNNPQGFNVLLEMLDRLAVECSRECAKVAAIEGIYRAQGKVAALEQLSSVIKESNK